MIRNAGGLQTPRMVAPRSQRKGRAGQSPARRDRQQNISTRFGLDYHGARGATRPTFPPARLCKKSLKKSCQGPGLPLVSPFLFRNTLNGWAASNRGDRQPHRTEFMSVKIRMKRVGAKNAPVFRIVVADGRSPRDGKFIEEIGTYQPRKAGDNFKLDLDRVKYWISKGAQPSDTVASFIKKASKAPVPA